MKEVYICQVFTKGASFVGLPSSFKSCTYNTLEEALKDRKEFMEKEKKSIEIGLYEVSPIFKGWINDDD